MDYSIFNSNVSLSFIDGRSEKLNKVLYSLSNNAFFNLSNSCNLLNIRHISKSSEILIRLLSIILQFTSPKNLPPQMLYKKYLQETIILWC
jgi:hypothetical protein